LNMSTKTLRMLFLTGEGRTSAISVPDPDENITQQQVEACMDHIVTNDIFDTNSGSLVEKIRAEVVERSVDTIYENA